MEIVDKFNAGIGLDEIKEKYNIAPSTLYYWRKQYTAIRTEDSSVTPRAYYTLEKHTDKLERIVAILQSSEPMSSLSTKQEGKLVDDLYGKYPVQTLCDAFNIPTATYYNYRLCNKNEKSWFEKRKVELMEKINIIEEETRRTYGVRRIATALRDMRYAVSEKYIAGLMREMGILNPRKDTKKDSLTLAHNERRIDLLKRNFEAERPNVLWASDIDITLAPAKVDANSIYNFLKSGYLFKKNKALFLDECLNSGILGTLNTSTQTKSKEKNAIFLRK